MRTRYSIAYAYPTSQRASELGFAKTGCYYLEGITKREDGSWSAPFVVPGTEGEACASESGRAVLHKLLCEHQETQSA